METNDFELEQRKQKAETKRKYVYFAEKIQEMKNKKDNNDMVGALHSLRDLEATHLSKIALNGKDLIEHRYWGCEENDSGTLQTIRGGILQILYGKVRDKSFGDTETRGLIDDVAKYNKLIVNKDKVEVRGISNDTDSNCEYMRGGTIQIRQNNGLEEYI